LSSARSIPDTHRATDIHQEEQNGLLDRRKQTQIHSGQPTDGHGADGKKETIDVGDWVFSIAGE